MTLRELAEQTIESETYDLVAKQIVKLHTDWSDQVDQVKDRYQKVINELYDLPGDDELKGHFILLDNIEHELSGVVETIHDTCLYDGETRWAIDLTDWNGLIDLEIKDNVCNNLSERLARILYEITFWGVTRQSVLNEASELSKMAKSKNNLIEVTLEQFLAEEA